MRRYRLLLIGLCLAGLGPAARADPDALKKIVIDQCLPNAMAEGDPTPCAAVDLSGGTALLKDRNGRTQFLLIPTTELSGIEDRRLLADNTPNYWQAAWAGRRLIEELLGHAVPRDDIGLAINSMYGRSQNQLHIHIDCLRVDVRQALQANADTIGPHWADLKGDLAGHRYRVMRIDGADLGDSDPFKILARGEPGAAANMGRETLAVAGAVLPDGRPGFYLLSDRADLALMDTGSSESLLDHDCAILK